MSERPTSVENPRQLFDPKSRLYRLNNLLGFPKDVLEKVYNSLEENARFLPNDDEHRKAREYGGTYNIEGNQIEKKYGNVADLFANKIFPDYVEYRKRQKDLPPEKKEEYKRVEQLRGQYYNMIRTLSSNAIEEGLRLIKERGGLEYLLTLLPNEQTPSP
ncbi:MAG: hypothetical protein Fur009_4340 [Candidatus Microgenomates bacterium]